MSTSRTDLLLDEIQRLQDQVRLLEREIEEEREANKQKRYFPSDKPRRHAAR